MSCSSVVGRFTSREDRKRFLHLLWSRHDPITSHVLYCSSVPMGVRRCTHTSGVNAHHELSKWFLIGLQFILNFYKRRHIGRGLWQLTVLMLCNETIGLTLLRSTTYALALVFGKRPEYLGGTTAGSRCIWDSFDQVGTALVVLRMQVFRADNLKRFLDLFVGSEIKQIFASEISALWKNRD